MQRILACGKEASSPQPPDSALGTLEDKCVSDYDSVALPGPLLAASCLCGSS